MIPKFFPIISLILFSSNLSAAGLGSTGAFDFLIIALLLILGGFIFYLQSQVQKKRRETEELLEKLALKERAWTPDITKDYISKVFHLVQKSWAEKNADVAKDFMSESLYLNHKVQTDLMVSNHEKNMLERIRLKEIHTAEILDYQDAKRDIMLVLIKGSMIDYVIDEITGKIKWGKKDEPEEISELWKFIRSRDRWVLDSIEQKVEIKFLHELHSKPEESP
ncbi:MAG TPA: Tim44-like domain-containing protein [Leptospiraceae bacterium]|nr:Tim44-like domain-containing protein [Leptospiraceae bacterium]HMY67875.1 Tim44-like domain-containing protein [Leptospiraceae bacterium]HNF14775.1 Tim44-like domain-containing protein [Leptospiraceae bacterium]HNF26398.1 Tim44-like domain-containing protein [Leptospiraceae bacterium]HNH08479.1 Tim44-like domain-containing protein [Leptospiraceae bacterium]